MAENMFKTLGAYVTEVFDTNKDGVVNFKDLLGLFPNHAVAIAFLVVDLLILVAEYRVWDVGIKITNGDPYKALGFVLVSALPFYLAQILWLYPRARGIQRGIALLMGAGGLYTSAQFGLADLSQTYDVTQIVNMVIYLGVAYIVMLLIYIVTDESVKAGRMKAQAHAKAQQQREINAITRSVLNDLRESLKEEEALKREFTPEAVEAHLDRLRGGKGKQNNSSGNGARMPQNGNQKPQDSRDDNPRPNPPQNNQFRVYDLAEFLQVIKMDKKAFSLWMEQHELFGETETREALKYAGLFPSDMSNGNFKRLFFEMFPDRERRANP